jgi:hypothetical protein
MEKQKFMFTKEELEAAFRAGQDSRDAFVDYLPGECVAISYETQFTFEDWYWEHLGPDFECDEYDCGECDLCSRDWESVDDRIEYLEEKEKEIQENIIKELEQIEGVQIFKQEARKYMNNKSVVLNYKYNLVTITESDGRYREFYNLDVNTIINLFK